MTVCEGGEVQVDFSLEIMNQPRVRTGAHLAPVFGT